MVLFLLNNYLHIQKLIRVKKALYFQHMIFLIDILTLQHSLQRLTASLTNILKIKFYEKCMLWKTHL